MKIKRLHPDAVIPKYQTTDAAGFDMHSVDDKIGIESGEWKLIDTGIAMSIPKGYVGLLFPRSGNAVKFGLNLINAVGVIDADYRASVKVPLFNNSDDTFIVSKRDRIAQMVIVPFEQVSFEEVDELDDTERGEGGFGSTGK